MSVKLPPALARKVGPFPLGVWILVIGAGVGIGVWRRRHGGAIESEEIGEDEQLADELAPFTNPGPGVVNAPVAMPGSTSVTGPARPEDNREWGRQGVELLIARGVAPGVASSAVWGYLQGDELTAQEAATVEQLIRALGPPPEGVEPLRLKPVPPAGPITPQPGPAPVVVRPPVNGKVPAGRVPARLPATPPKRRGGSSYTVRSGDTLSAIGAREGVSWHAIYRANRERIEDRARAAGRRDSDGGHWIYPGTVLRIP